MSKTKLIFAGLLAAAVSSAFAQSVTQAGSGPMTIQEWTNKQAEIKRAELESKLEEARHKGNAASSPVPVAAPVARTCDDDLAMYAVYGIGRNLRADFGYRGATITAAAGDHADMGGWTVEELTPSRAIMVRTGSKGKGKSKGSALVRCPLYLSSGVRDFAAPPTMPTMQASTDSSLSVPPISPVSSPVTSAAKSVVAGGSAK